MENLAVYILIGLATFAITNIDDLLLLSFYFASTHYGKGNVIVGQYLGVLSIIAISMSGLILGTALETKWIGLLGLFPVFLGVKGILSILNKRTDQSNLTRNKSNIQFLNVALITLANGADNIGVYTPLFASSDLSTVMLYIFIFILMVGIWCAFAYYLVSHPLIKNKLDKYGHFLLPFFLILLGIWILAESDALSLLL